MKNVTILTPTSAVSFGAKISTKLKESLICPRFVYYETIVDILETVGRGGIDCLLIDSELAELEKTLLLTSELATVSMIKINRNTEVNSQTKLSFKALERSDTLHANLVYATYMMAKEREQTELQSHFVPEQRLIVKDSGHIHVIKVEDLAWVGGAGNYVELHMINRERSILHRDTMSSMEKSLKTFGFSRIHKSSLVNLNAISELKTRDNGDYDVILENGDSLHLSRRYKQNLSSLLQVNAS